MTTKQKAQMIGAVGESFFAVLATLFALGLPATTAPFVVMAFFMCMIQPFITFMCWVDRLCDL